MDDQDNIQFKDLNTYKIETIQLCEQKGWLGPSIEQVWMYFTEEVGELASAIRRQKNQFRDKKKVKLEAELGDVFSYLFQISHMLNIDLEQMWENQKVKMIKKKYYNINESSFKRGYITSNKKELSNDDKEESTLQKSWKVVKK